jgi:hypothetical protein
VSNPASPITHSPLDFFKRHIYIYKKKTFYPTSWIKKKEVDENTIESYIKYIMLSVPFLVWEYVKLTLETKKC